MKYYIYISDSKVDMLFPQVPHEIKDKVATEFKIDIKVFSASRKREVESESDNRIARLEAVVDFIREFGNLGSVDEPDQFVEGNMPMRWGPYDGGSSELSPVVYFGGQTDKTTVGLGGSSINLLGNSGAGGTASHSHSATPALLAFLSKDVDVQQKLDAYTKDIARAGRTDIDSRFTPMDAVDIATTQMWSGPEQNVEFVAKRLAFGKPTYNPAITKNALLATPLYVAMTD